MKVKCDSICTYHDCVVVSFMGCPPENDEPCELMNDEVGLKLRFTLEKWDGQYKPGNEYVLKLNMLFGPMCHNLWHATTIHDSSEPCPDCGQKPVDVARIIPQ